jgi:hemolysin III
LLFGVVWGLAVIGIFREVWLARKNELASLILYILMGWIALIAVEPLVRTLTWNGFAWLASGGLAYTVGIVFYANDRKFSSSHGIWHLFVLAGSTLHYFAILLYVA